MKQSATVIHPDGSSVEHMSTEEYRARLKSALQKGDQYHLVFRSNITLDITDILNETRDERIKDVLSQ